MSQASPSSRHYSGLRDWLVAFSGGLTLAFSAWGLGGIPAWCLHVLLSGALLTLFFALCPLPSSARSTPAGANALRLLRWPPFYLSLAFLLYILIGALNPAIEQVHGENGWWVEAVSPPYGVDLPISVRSDYEPMNAWRSLANLSAAFVLMWGLWAGISRRKAALWVLWIFLLNGAAMAFVGILQHLSGAGAVLWNFPSSNQNFWGSFFYRNQGVAFLNLVLVAAGVLFFYHSIKARERLASGGPHFLCFFLFALVVASIGLALSRGGILFAAILSLVFLCFVTFHTLRGLEQISTAWAALIPCLLLSLGAFSLIQYVDLKAIEERFGDIEAAIENADKDARMLSTQATWDMAQDRLWLGWGAGSFRYIFPMYQKNYPQIFYARYHKKKGWIGRKMFRYAHNDIVQFIAEYGLIGTCLVLLTLLWVVLSAFRLPGLSALFLLAGFAVSMSHAFLDFIFNSPAYWTAFVALIAATAKLLQLEAKRRASAPSI